VRVKTIKVTNVKGITESFDCDHVTVFCGPNGTGKTTAVSAVAWALTGRFPGIGEKTAPLLQLGTPGRAMGVTLELTNGMVIKRGFTTGGQSLVHFALSSEVLTGKVAQTRIAGAFGDTELFTSALDAERGVWRMSPEKFQQWVFGLCTSAAAWTRERLEEAVGDSPEDWDGSAHKDPATCLAINIERVGESIRVAQRMVREAETTAATITSIREVTEADVQAARRDRDAALAAVTALKTALSDPKPVEPTAPSIARHLLEAMRVELADLEQATEKAAVVITNAHASEVSARQHLQFMRTSQDRCADGECPVCGSNPGQTDWISVNVQFAEEAHAAAVQSLSVARNYHRAIADKRDSLSRDSQHLAVSWERYDAAVESWRAAVAAWTDRRANAPKDVSEAALQSAEMQLRVATDALAVVEDAYSKFREVNVHMGAVDRAKAREEHLKALRNRLRDIRLQMLRDACIPLQDALLRMSPLAPHGTQWAVDVDGDFVQVGMKRGDKFIPYATMSGAERLRATLALHAAYRALRPQPWSGLFVDAFEQVYLPSDRYDILSALGQIQSIDNVFVAGAFDADSVTSSEGPLLPLSGCAWHVRRRSSSAASP